MILASFFAVVFSKNDRTKTMLTALKTLLAYYVKTPEQGADLEEAEP